jgi:hypothetical protein
MPIRAGELGLETPDRRRMTGLPVHRRDFAGAVIARNVVSVACRRRSPAEELPQLRRQRARARVVVHRIIAVGDYVWAHVNFLNLFNDDPEDTGIAGVDIYKMDADGKAIEHWDTLQIVGDPKNSAPLIAPNIPRANANGMF